MKFSEKPYISSSEMKHIFPLDNGETCNALQSRGLDTSSNV